MRLTDLIASRADNSLSMPKLAAATGHLLMAAAFFRLQVIGDEPFNEMLWMVYGAFAIAHAAYDKTAAVVVAFKEKKLAAEHQGTVQETMTTSKTTSASQAQ